MVACIHPIGIHGTQILDLKLDQGTSKLGGITELLCEFIGLEFVASAENVHEELDNGVHWRKGIGEQDEANDDWELSLKTKGLVERVVVDKYREQGEDVEEMSLNESQHQPLPKIRN